MLIGQQAPEERAALEVQVAVLAPELELVVEPEQAQALEPGQAVVPELEKEKVSVAAKARAWVTALAAVRAVEPEVALEKAAGLGKKPLQRPEAGFLLLLRCVHQSKGL
jgi:hypothetical protein